MASGNSTGGLSKPECSRRQAAIQEYIKKATAARRVAGCTQQSGRQKPSDLRTHYAITLGKMVYNQLRGRGVLVRSFSPMRAHFHPDCEYSTVLQEAKNVIFNGGQGGAEYYIADGSGMPVCRGDGIVKICNTDQTTSNLKWTLRTHIEISKTYPSKLRLYCVEKEKDTVRSDSSSASSESETAAHMTPKGKRVHVEEPQSPLSPVPTYSSDTSTSGIDASSHSIRPDNASAAFVLMFAHPILRKYAEGLEKYAFSTGVSQSEALARRLRDDDELMLECRETLDAGLDAGGEERILDINPLRHGFFLSSLYTGQDPDCYDFIGHYNMVSGEICYATPRDDAEFATWTGWKVSQQDWAVLLVCVALNGYNGVASYIWQKDGKDLDETYPLLYTKATGKYQCTVTVPTVPQKATKDFEVKDENGVLIVTEGPSHIYHLLNASITETAENLQQEKSQGHDMCAAVYGNLELLTDIMKDNSSTGKLSIVREIGRGSFGIVYLACWRGTVVAAKQIPVPSRQCGEALKEVQALREIQHPNILSILGVDVGKDHVSIITNFVPGTSLHSRIFDATHPRMDFREKMYVAVQLAQALVYLHTATPPMVHGDVKPSNVLVESGSLHVYLADFGLTRVIVETKIVGTATCQQGTPGFQPPEQLTAKGFDTRADVYAFAGVLVELFGEKTLWEGLLPFQIICKVVTSSEVPPYSHIDPRLQALVQQCFKPHKERVDMVYTLCVLLAIIQK